MKPLLIVKTGSAIEGVPPAWGDFEHWIASTTDLPEAQWAVAHVAEGETLPAPETLSGVVITGSAAMVTDKLAWSEYTASWVKAAVTSNLPILGICYGHQLLAHALGGQVGLHPKGREIGTTTVIHTNAAYSDSLFSRMPARYPVNVSHSQTVCVLPESAVILASNSFEPHHAVRFADQAWGVQFHPEFDARVMRRYLELRSAQVQEEGLDVQGLLNSVTETPDAVILLQHFVDLIRG